MVDLRYILTTLLVPGLFACAVPANESAPGPRFVDVTEQAGILHRHEKPQLDPQLANIMPWMCSVGAAVAAGDYDGDGWVDLYLSSSRKGSPNRLYRNNGDGTFTDVAPAVGLADVNDEGGVSMDAIWTDLDNDGRLDLYLVRWGRDVLFAQQLDGTFRDVTRERLRQTDGSPGTPWANGNAVIALDYDLDGRLDLYVGNYFTPVDLWHLTTTRIMHDSFEVARNAGPNFLYRQEPDGTFSEVAAKLGVADTGWTLAVGSVDLNNDGWPDLYSANDFGPDQLFYNDGRGGFRNVSSDAIAHDTRKGMNVDFGDFNNDGWLDVYVTNITTAEYLKEGNMLWRNNGPGADGVTRFMDVSPESGTYDGGWGWGAKFLDQDNDGDLDLFTVNGFVSAGPDSYWYDLASWSVLDKDPADSRNWPEMRDRSFSGYEAFRFWRNEGYEEFRECASEVGLASDRDGRGVALLDYDNDGDTDIVVANQGQAPHLFRNDSAGEAHWLDVRLVGAPDAGTNADAIGARVTLVAGGTRQIRERDGGAGFAGQSDTRLHFGLGSLDRAELLEVRWPDGGLQYVEDVAVDRVLTIRQDPALYAAMSLVAVDAPERREAPAEPTRTVPAIDPAELDRALAGAEGELRREPLDHALAYAYRGRAATHGRHDRAIAFFRELADQRPQDDSVLLELSVAYVDKIPTCGGLAAIVCKGTLARRSLDVLDQIIERRPDWWVTRYGRGMNHLHWPRALRHSSAAVEDFARCVELQARADVSDDYLERVRVLLGDARAKDSEFAAARETWRDGLRLFPDSAPLRERLAVDGDDALLDYILDVRSLERPIDTDFSFVGH